MNYLEMLKQYRMMMFLSHNDRTTNRLEYAATSGIKEKTWIQRKPLFLHEQVHHTKRANC